MSEYNMVVRTTIQQVVSVEADSAEEARDKACEVANRPGYIRADFIRQSAHVVLCDEEIVEIMSDLEEEGVVKRLVNTEDGEAQWVMLPDPAEMA